MLLMLLIEYEENYMLVAPSGLIYIHILVRCNAMWCD